MHQNVAEIISTQTAIGFRPNKKSSAGKRNSSTTMKIKQI